MTLKQLRYTLNIKAAAGVIDGGLGGTQLNSLLTEMDVPPLNPQIFKSPERIVGQAVKELADDSCLKMLKEEKRLTIESIKVEPGMPVPLRIGLDGAWPKRGSGFNYDSL